MSETRPPKKRVRRTVSDAAADAPQPGRFAATAEAAPEEPLFLGSRLMILTNLMRRITTSRFQRTYDLALVEGWIILRLGTNASLSLDALARRNGLEKSQMSRSISRLVERGLVKRCRNEHNASELQLDLTEAGRKVYRRMIRRAPEYNAWLAAGLTSDEVAALTALVDRLIENSRHNLAIEFTKRGRQP